MQLPERGWQLKDKDMQQTDRSLRRAGRAVGVVDSGGGESCYYVSEVSRKE